MSQPIDDTLTPRNGANFPIVDGPIRIRAMPHASFPAPGSLPTGTRLAASDEGYAVYCNRDGSAWIQDSGGSLPDATNLPQGTVLIVDVSGGIGSWSERNLIAADIQPNFAISGIGTGGGYASIKEVGDTIINPSFTLSYINGPATSATVNDGSGALSLLSPFTSFSYSKTYTVGSVGSAITWSFATAKGPANSNGSVSSFSEGRIYYGLSLTGTYDSTFANALAVNLLTGSFARTYSFGSGDGTKHAFLIIPTALGTPTSFKTTDGFGVPMTKVASSVNVVNGHGASVPCDFYMSNSTVVIALDLVVS